MKKLTIDTEKLRGAMWKKRTQIATELGMHPNSLTRKLSGNRRFYLDELNTIAGALGRDTMEFLREVETDGESASGGEQ